MYGIYYEAFIVIKSRMHYRLSLPDGINKPLSSSKRTKHIEKYLTFYGITKNYLLNVQDQKCLDAILQFFVPQSFFSFFLQSQD
jgi:hypothetical protein